MGRGGIWTNTLSLLSDLGGAGGNPRERNNFFTKLAIISVIASTILFCNYWFRHDFEELRINAFYQAPLNGTCELGDPYIDSWVCCKLTWGTCDMFCGNKPCNKLMHRYDGTREEWLLKDPTQVNQPCCSGSCCYSQTCYSTDDGYRRRHLRDSDGSEEIRELKDNVKRDDFADEMGKKTIWERGLEAHEDLDKLPYFLLSPPPRSVATDIEGSENYKLMDDEATKKTSADAAEGKEEEEQFPMEGGQQCSCDIYGTTRYWFECSVCYDGVVELTYIEPGHEREQSGYSKSSHHPGPCSGATSYECAENFVHEHRNETTRECWYDPVNASRVVFHKGWTIWRGVATLASLVVCCGCCWCGIHPLRNFCIDIIATRPRCCCCCQRLLFGQCCCSRCCCGPDDAPGNRYKYSTVQLTAPYNQGSVPVTDAIPIQRSSGAALTSPSYGSTAPAPSAPPASKLAKNGSPIKW